MQVATRPSIPTRFPIQVFKRNSTSGFLYVPLDVAGAPPAVWPPEVCIVCGWAGAAFVPAPFEHDWAGACVGRATFVAEVVEVPEFGAANWLVDGPPASAVNATGAEGTDAILAPARPLRGVLFSPSSVHNMTLS